MTAWPTPKLHTLANTPGIFAVLATSDLGETFDLCTISDRGATLPEDRWKNRSRLLIQLTQELGEATWSSFCGDLSMRCLVQGRDAIVVFSERNHEVGKSLARAIGRILAALA